MPKITKQHRFYMSKTGVAEDAGRKLPGFWLRQKPKQNQFCYEQN